MINEVYKQVKTNLHTNTETREMDKWVVFIGFRLVLGLLKIMSFADLGGSVNILKQNTESIDSNTAAGVINEASSMKCDLQGTPRSPAFSMSGDFVVGGAISLHYTQYSVIYNYTKKPEPPRCTGRLVRKLNVRIKSVMCIVRNTFICCIVCSQDLM